MHSAHEIDGRRPGAFFVRDREKTTERRAILAGVAEEIQREFDPDPIESQNVGAGLVVMETKPSCERSDAT